MKIKWTKKDIEKYFNESPIRKTYFEEWLKLERQNQTKERTKLVKKFELHGDKVELKKTFTESYYDGIIDKQILKFTTKYNLKLFQGKELILHLSSRDLKTIDKEFKKIKKLMEDE